MQCARTKWKTHAYKEERDVNQSNINGLKMSANYNVKVWIIYQNSA